MNASADSASRTTRASAPWRKPAHASSLSDSAGLVVHVALIALPRAELRAGGSGMEVAACADYARRWLARASCVRISFSRCSGRHGFKR